MADLRSMIDQAVRDVRPGRDAFERAMRRARSRQIRRRAGSAAVAIVLTIAAGGLLWRAFLSPPPQDPAAPPRGVIVFTTQRPDDMTPIIAVMLPDGSDVRELGPGLDPAVSPDGSRIAFVRTSGTGGGIFVMNADGTDVRQLTKNASGLDEAPSWSPDGATIVFSRSTFVSTDPDPVASPELRDLYTVSASSGGLDLLLGGKTDDFLPDWSPDGTRVAFARVTDPSADGPAATSQIWTLDLASADEHQVTDADLGAWRPDWSPDGMRIVFDAGQSLYVVNASGGAPTRVGLPESISSPFQPRWSPDASRIAFVAGGDDMDHDIFVVEADGSNMQRLERPGTNDASPSWGLPIDDNVVDGSPTDAPSTPAPPAEEGRDVGLTFRLCEVETVGGLDLLGSGAPGRAWTGIPVKDDGTCAKFPGAMKYLVAVDHTGDGLADSWADLPFGCYNGCAPHDGTDLDADGDEELIVSYFFSIMDFSFFDVRADGGGDLHVEPILVAGPGHEPARIEAREPLRIDAWGDAGYGSSVQCEGYPSAPVIVWSWSYAPVESDRPTEVHVTRLRLGTDGLFHVVGTNDYTVSAGQLTGLPFQGDLGLACGVRWGR